MPRKKKSAFLMGQEKPTKAPVPLSFWTMAQSRLDVVARMAMFVFYPCVGMAFLGMASRKRPYYNPIFRFSATLPGKEEWL